MVCFYTSDVYNEPSVKKCMVILNDLIVDLVSSRIQPCVSDNAYVRLGLGTRLGGGVGACSVYAPTYVESAPDLSIVVPSSRWLRPLSGIENTIKILVWLK